jgi:hypothetical protein
VEVLPRSGWSSKIADRKPVLTDQRRLYTQTYGTNASNLSVISQGGVTYLAAQKLQPDGFTVS